MMGKIDYNQGNIHIVLETGDDELVAQFEKIFSMVKDGGNVRKKAKGTPAETPETGKESTEGPEVSFGKYLTDFRKLSKPETILAFAEWIGKPFRSKDYLTVEKDRGVPIRTLDKLRKGFHPRLTALKRASKIRNVKKGVYIITEKGKKTLDKKRK